MRTTKEADEQFTDDEDINESGKPGGGRGRVDEVGHSGVYPASGPEPEGNAALRIPGEWGQGGRGVEGYQDHGDSELHIPGLIGGEDEEQLEAAPLHAREVPASEWGTFFQEFSARHSGEPILVEISSYGEGAIETETEILADELPLTGIDLEVEDDPQRPSIQVMVGMTPSDHLTHTITEVAHVWHYQTDDGEDAMLEIEAEEGPTTMLQL